MSFAPSFAARGNPPSGRFIPYQFLSPTKLFHLHNGSSASALHQASPDLHNLHNADNSLYVVGESDTHLSSIPREFLGAQNIEVDEHNLAITRERRIILAGLLFQVWNLLIEKSTKSYAERLWKENQRTPLMTELQFKSAIDSQSILVFGPILSQRQFKPYESPEIWYACYQQFLQGIETQQRDDSTINFDQMFRLLGYFFEQNLKEFDPFIFNQNEEDELSMDEVAFEYALRVTRSLAFQFVFEKFPVCLETCKQALHDPPGEDGKRVKKKKKDPLSLLPLYLKKRSQRLTQKRDSSDDLAGLHSLFLSLIRECFDQKHHTLNALIREMQLHISDYRKPYFDGE